MFYGANDQADYDYYNSYKIAKKDNESILNILIKVLFIIFLIVSIIAGYIFITKKQTLSASPIKEQKMVYKIYKEPIPKEYQTQKKQLSSEEIKQIVQIIISELNNVPKKAATKERSPIMQERLVQDDESFVKALILESAEEKTTTIPPNKNRLPLKDINHYNKVVINSSEAAERDDEKLPQDLSSKLDDILSTATEDKEPTDYTRMISKELDVRSNEMRVIIVQKGDTLSKIAYRAYGDYDAYPRIFLANPEVIRNPDQIFVGQRLRIPF